MYVAQLLHLRSIFFIILIGALSSCSYYHVSSERVSSVSVNKNSEIDEEINAFISPYSERLGLAMDEVIGTASESIYKAKPESPLGNFLSDIVQSYAIDFTDSKQTLFSVVNYGGIRLSEIAQGDIRTRSIYELLPFENIVVIVEMNKEQLIEFLNHISKRGPWPVSSELSYNISIADTSVNSVMINNEALNKNEMYYVAMPDYIANGGDDCTFLKKLDRESTDLLLRDLVIEYIKEQDTPLSAKVDGRISYE